MPVVSDLGRRITEIRVRRGLSQNQVIARIPHTKNTYKRVERGTGNPRIETLQHIANALSVHISQLLMAPGSPIPRGRGVTR